MAFLFKKKQQPHIVQISHTIKLVMLACETGGSGKTCLARAIVGQPFQQSTQITTTGYYQKQFQKNKQIYKLAIWDTNSNQRSRSVIPLFLKPQIYLCAIIAVNPKYFSISSFKNFLKWLISVNKDMLVLLCQCFSDLQQQKNQDFQLVKQIYKQEFKYFKISSKTGQNVKQLRNFIVNYFHNLKDNLHQKYNPKYSPNFQKRFEELSNCVQSKLLNKISQLLKENQIFRKRLQELNQDPNYLLNNFKAQNGNSLPEKNQKQENKQQQKYIQVFENQQQKKQIVTKKKRSKTQTQYQGYEKQKQKIYHFYENSFTQNGQQKKKLQDIIQNVQPTCVSETFPVSCHQKESKQQQNQDSFYRDSFQQIIRQKYPYKLTQYQIKKASEFLQQEYLQFFDQERVSKSVQDSISISQIIEEASNKKNINIV